MNKKQKLIYLYFIILPIIDVITSLITRFTDINLSLGMIVKGLTMVFSVMYIFLWSKSKYRKASIYYIIILAIYGIMYFITKTDMLSLHNIVHEISYAFHYLYYPIMIIGVFNIFEDFKISKEMIYKIILINSFIYVFLLLIPYITNTSFNSYRWNNVKGQNGWFYSANETGAISILLLSGMLLLLDNNKKYKILFTIPMLISIALIGTKVSYLGMIIVTVLVALTFVLREKKDRFKLPIILILFLAIICNFSPTLSNLENRADQLDDTDEVVGKKYKYNRIDDIIKDKTLGKVIKLALNGREEFFLKNYSIYETSGASDKLFGISWSNREKINYDVKKKLIEIDYLDIFIHYGIIGFIVYFIPLIYLFIRMVKEKTKKMPEFWLYFFLLLLELFVSSFAGHVLSAPAVSIYLVLVMYLIKLNTVKKKNVS